MRADDDRLARPDEGQARGHVLLDGVGELGAPGEEEVEQVSLPDRPGDLAEDDGWLGLDDRHLRDGVLAEDVDGVADGLGRMGVDERGQVATLGVEHVADGAVTVVTDEAVGRHPLVVEDLGEVAAAPVREEDDDDGVLGQVARRP